MDYPLSVQAKITALAEKSTRFMIQWCAQDLTDED
jgi:hypothetical protein